MSSAAFNNLASSMSLASVSGVDDITTGFNLFNLSSNSLSLLSSPMLSLFINRINV